jgi:hypothetical protein
MSARRGTKFVHEGSYVAAVEVDWIDSDTGWSPCLSLGDARKLDEAREALRRGDFKKVAQLGRVYELTPLAV